MSAWSGDVEGCKWGVGRSGEERRSDESRWNGKGNGNGNGPVTVSTVSVLAGERGLLVKKSS
jgi:hypothetical protein